MNKSRDEVKAAILEKLAEFTREFQYPIVVSAYHESFDTLAMASNLPEHYVALIGRKYSEDDASMQVKEEITKEIAAFLKQLRENKDIKILTFKRAKIEAKRLSLDSDSNGVDNVIWLIAMPTEAGEVEYVEHVGGRLELSILHAGLQQIGLDSTLKICTSLANEKKAAAAHNATGEIAKPNLEEEAR